MTDNLIVGSHIVVTDQNNEQLLDNGNILDNRLLIGGTNATIINNRILSDNSISSDTNILADRIILSDANVTGKYILDKDTNIIYYRKSFQNNSEFRDQDLSYTYKNVCIYLYSIYTVCKSQME